MLQQIKFDIHAQCEFINCLLKYQRDIKQKPKKDTFPANWQVVFKILR